MNEPEYKTALCAALVAMDALLCATVDEDLSCGIDLTLEQTAARDGCLAVFAKYWEEYATIKKQREEAAP